MRSFVVRALVALFALETLGCGDDETTAVVTPPVGCAAGEWLRDDGTCVAPGLPADMPCAPAQWLREDGQCIPAGVPPDGCGDGFVHDGDRGCNAILPAAPCSSGLMAVPGETACREIAPCAPGKWGDIAVEPDTEYVDASYAGMDSDGSALKPWTSVQAGVDAAAPGAIVAIAEGSYVEDILIVTPVRLWGVCPALVELVGTGVQSGVVEVDAPGTEMRGLSIRGAAYGFASVGATDVLIERVWVHDTAGRGIHFQGAASGIVRASLVERSHQAALSVAGSDVTVDASVMRDTELDPEDLYARGVNVQSAPSPSTFLLRGSVVEGSGELGIYVASSQATVESSVVRDTKPNGAARGRGVNIEPDVPGGGRATLLLRTSVVERTRALAVFISGADATLEASVVRDTLPTAEGVAGRGVTVQDHFQTGTSVLHLRTSLIDSNKELGVLVADSQATVEACAVRDTQPDVEGGGHGIEVQSVGLRSTLDLRNSLVERSHQVGVFVAGSDAIVDACVVRDTQSNAEAHHGRGIVAQAHPAGVPATLHVHASLSELNHEAAVAVIGSNATIDACLLRDTLASGQGAGDGVMVISVLGGASATITSTRVHQSALAAIASWGAVAAVGTSALTCQAFDLNSDNFGDSMAQLEDLGGNSCGCPEANTSCKAVSAGLAPPEALDPLQ